MNKKLAQAASSPLVSERSSRVAYDDEDDVRLVDDLYMMCEQQMSAGSLKREDSIRSSSRNSEIDVSLNNVNNMENSIMSVGSYQHTTGKFIYIYSGIIKGIGIGILPKNWIL